MDLSYNKIKELDDIYNSTKESQGAQNALLAIRYVLFNDDSVFKDGIPKENKYTFISSNNDARKKAKLMQLDDLGQIMIKYCMASFGLRGKKFNITDDEFVHIQEKIDDLEISAYDMIEFVAYTSIHDPLVAYKTLFQNTKILGELVTYMIKERYEEDLKESLDNFNGVIDNEELNPSLRFSYYEAYTNIDKSFAEIKRNDKYYIK
jgi:hypothetical protein